MHLPVHHLAPFTAIHSLVAALNEHGYIQYKQALKIDSYSTDVKTFSNFPTLVAFLAINISGGIHNRLTRGSHTIGFLLILNIIFITSVSKIFSQEKYKKNAI